MILSLIEKYRVVPVLVLHDQSRAERIGKLLVEHKLPIVELTLRTQSAFESLSELVKIEGLCVGVGSVQTVHQLIESRSLGASFAVSAGISERLVSKALELEFDYLPGVSTPSEILEGIHQDQKALKWFPATALGGVKTLEALSAPFPNMRFVPTGGITKESRHEYLALDSVLGVGGSWMFSKSDSDQDFFDKLEESLIEIRN